MGSPRTTGKVIICSFFFLLCSFGVAAAAGITGVVTAIDVFGGSMSVRWNRAVIVFDLKNPELKGYKGLGDIRKGDTVTVGYVKNGIRIAKGAQGIEKRSGEVAAGQERKGEARKGARDGRPRVAQRSRGTSFEDVDENKDGVVNAAELSQIVPGLTMQQFRQYDANGDGKLDKQEFYAIDPRAVKR